MDRARPLRPPVSGFGVGVGLRAPHYTAFLESRPAVVSFAWKREVWTTNVDDTLEFARRVTQLERLRRFLHVSTALVSGAATDRVVHEDEFPGTARQFTLYTKSKAEIERRLPALLDGGRSCGILEPVQGLLCGLSAFHADQTVSSVCLVEPVVNIMMSASTATCERVLMTGFYFFFDNEVTTSSASAAVYLPIGPVL